MGLDLQSFVNMSETSRASSTRSSAATASRRRSPGATARYDERLRDAGRHAEPPAEDAPADVPAAVRPGRTAVRGADRSPANRTAPDRT